MDNLGLVLNILEKSGARGSLSADPDAIMHAPIRSFRDYPNGMATRERALRAFDSAGVLPLVRRVVRAW